VSILRLSLVSLASEWNPRGFKDVSGLVLDKCKLFFGMACARVAISVPIAEQFGRLCLIQIFGFFSGTFGMGRA